jgi:sugar/nucleoside kinase (ribokinase family)
MSARYLAIGNPTVDHLLDGQQVVGGTVVYAAMQAARLGWEVDVRGAGSLAALETLLPTHDRVTWHIQEAPAATQFTNDSRSGVRVQYLHATAGRIDIPASLPPSDVLHIGPVDDEVDLDAIAAAATSSFVGLTAQGVFRWWGDDRIVHLRPVAISNAVAQFLDVVVVGAIEEPVAADMLRDVVAAGGLAVVTHGRDGCEVRSATTTDRFASAFSVDVVDDTGAGDVFAAGLFMQLGSGASLADAVRFGQAAAAECVRGWSVTAIADDAGIARRLESADDRSNS